MVKETFSRRGSRLWVAGGIDFSDFSWPHINTLHTSFHCNFHHEFPPLALLCSHSVLASDVLIVVVVASVVLHRTFSYYLLQPVLHRIRWGSLVSFYIHARKIVWNWNVRSVQDSERKVDSYYRPDSPTCVYSHISFVRAFSRRKINLKWRFS